MSTAITGFSKNEAISLTGISFHKLSYLDRNDILKPQRISLPGLTKKFIRYSFSDILELRAIASLRQNASLQAIRKLIDFIRTNADDDRLSSKLIMVAGDEIFWINPDFSDVGQMIATVKNPGQIVHCELTILPNLQDAILESAKHSNIISFEEFLERANLGSRVLAS